LATSEVLLGLTRLLAFKRPIRGSTLDEVETRLQAQRVRCDDTAECLDAEGDAVAGRIYERGISNENRFEIHVYESEEAASAARRAFEGESLGKRDRLYQADNVLAIVHGRRRAPAEEHPIAAAFRSAEDGA
jgi:hypothetical protein